MGEEFDDAQEGVAGGDDLPIIHAVLAREFDWEDLAIHVTDHFLFTGEAATFHKGTVSRHEMQLAIFDEEERVWQVLKGLPHAIGAQSSEPLVARCQGCHDAIMHIIHRIHT